MTNKQIVEELREKIFTAIGEASMCWEPRPTGVFDSTAAEKIGNRLADEILSRIEAEDKAVEPLAVLADRKGKYHGHTLRIYRMEKGWVIDISGLMSNTILGCATYQEAESKARTYLNSLPDKEAK